MSVAVRVIPCLDVSHGRVVKGVNFENLRDAGDPVELVSRYDKEGADELTFLDVSASTEARGTMLDVVRRTADEVFIRSLLAVGSVALTTSTSYYVPVQIKSASIPRPLRGRNCCGNFPSALDHNVSSCRWMPGVFLTAERLNRVVLKSRRTAAHGAQGLMRSSGLVVVKN